MQGRISIWVEIQPQRQALPMFIAQPLHRWGHSSYCFVGTHQHHASVFLPYFPIFTLGSNIQYNIFQEVGF